MSVVLTELDGAVGRVTLNRPDALNAVTLELARELEAAVRTLAGEASVIAVRGAGGTFCAGGDFGEVARLRERGESSLAELFGAFGAACDAIAAAPVPVVAAVEGVAMAGGFELMQACDLAIVAAEARISDNHLNYGMVPGGGSSQRLPRLIGRQRAAALVLTGERLSGVEAAAWGIAYRSVPADSFNGAVEKLLARMAGHDRAALVTAKGMLRDGLELPLADGLALERERVVTHIAGAAGGAAIARFSERTR